MKTYSLKLVEKIKVARQTMQFVFEKPKSFSYLAGQYGVWTIPNLNPVDKKGNRRDFTISSAPFENFLSFTTRLRDSAFKNWAVKMKSGNKIEMEGPFGDLFLPTNAKQPLVFLAGGIGITPFRSIVAQATYDLSPQKIILFYSNRILEDVTYFDELKELERKNSNFKMIATLTQPEKSKRNWTGQTGYITKTLLKDHLNLDLNSYLYFIAGPHVMVDAMRETLSKAKVKPENVLGENFGGY